MFSEGNMNIQNNNINSVINEKNLNTSLYLGLSNIKCEFEEEETQIQFGVLEEDVNNKFSLSITKGHEDGEIPGSSQKNQATSDKFSHKDVKIRYSEVKSDIKEESNTSSEYELSNMKCEFEEEETKIQFGDSENKLHEENVDHKFFCITKLQDNEDGEFPENFQKNQPTSDKFSQEDVNIEYGECISDINEEFNTSLDCELSNTKCEFEEEETIIQYGILDDQLLEENTTLHILNDASSQKNDPTLFELGLKRHDEIQRKEKWLTQNNHTKSPAGENPFKCETCGQCFKRKHTLNSHRMIHKLENPNKCEICGKCFSENGILKKHMMIHTGKKLHKCETCSKCFNFKHKLNRHMKIHTGEKPHKCEICGKCFNMKHHLKQHIMIHTGEKPHKCETCSKNFNFKNKLKQHMRIHTGEKPYKCEICGKCFGEKGSLKKHIMIHTGEKLHKCETCSKYFNHKDKLNRHMKIHRAEKSRKHRK